VGERKFLSVISMKGVEIEVDIPVIADPLDNGTSEQRLVA